MPHIKRRRISAARSNIPSGFVSEHQTPRWTSNRWWAFWWSRRSLHRGDLCQPAGALRCAFPPNRSLIRGSHAKAVWLFRILADAPADLCGGYSVLARTLGPLDIRKEWLMVGDVVGSECRHLRFPISGRDFFVCWGSLGYLGGTLTLCLITRGLLVPLMYSLRFSLVYFSEIYFAFCQDPGNKICHMVLLMTNHILSVGLFVVHGSCRPARQGFMICNWSRFWRIKMRRLIRDMELIVPAQIKQRSSVKLTCCYHQLQRRHQVDADK